MNNLISTNTARAGIPVLFCFLLFGLPAFTQNPSTNALPVERYALYVAANDGGAEREKLRYAVSDAERMARTLTEIGGVTGENSLILTDPGRAAIERAFKNFARQIEGNAGRAKRTEFIFYYSGHSDETALLLGKETLSYAELKKQLAIVPTDVHVVMLDSCYSGEFIRTKGGQRQKPFLVDDSSVVQGHAYLSSSSAFESSQESDAIQASYFTHSLVTGLRGAADTSGDQKVSLNELYHYAFNDTLSRTEKSHLGPQHPSFNITLVGSGDLVLTDISEADSVLIFPNKAEGRYFIRTQEGVLVSEINKVAGTEIALALGQGTYAVTMLSAKDTSVATVILSSGDRLTLSDGQFAPIARSMGRARGDAEDTVEVDSQEPVAPYAPWVFGFVPGVTVPRNPGGNAKMSLNALVGKNNRINGVQANGFMGIITQDLHGAQVSGFLSTANGSMEGVQASGFMNIADGPIKGAQLSGFGNIVSAGIEGFQGSGFFNVAGGTVEGVQATAFINIAHKVDGAQLSGTINVAREVDGIQIGVVNVARNNSGLALGLLNFIQDGVLDVGVYLDTDSNLFLQYQGGTDLFYTTFLMGFDTQWSWDWDHQTETFQLGFGIGNRFQLSRRLSLDLELIGRWIFDVTEDNPYMDKVRENGEIVIETEEDWDEFYDEFYAGFIPSLRLSFNVAIARHFALFTAVNLDFRFLDIDRRAFEIGKHSEPIKLDKEELWVYPSLSFGVKF